MIITITPIAIGKQLLRYSLPLLPGFLTESKTLAVSVNGTALPTAVRVLTWHAAGSPRSARRAMVTWVYEFISLDPVEFTLEAREPADAPALPLRLPVAYTMQDDELAVTWEGGPIIKARLVAPPVVPATVYPPAPIQTEVVESNGLYRWERITIPDPQFPRVIEVRADVLGQVVLIGHVQRDLPGNDYAPDLGWVLDFRHLFSRLEPEDAEMTTDGVSIHRFATGKPCTCYLEDPGYQIYHPAAPFRRKGSVTIRRNVQDRTDYRYLRAEAGDVTPFQQSAWLRFEMVIALEGTAQLTPTLACPHACTVDWRNWDALYATGEPQEATESVLAQSVAYHHDIVLNCMAAGDDWGNIISYDENARATGTYAMNRLNHCPPIFFEGWRSGDRRLVEAGVLWCENFHDLTIWWGPQYTGGTRYNYGPLVDHHPPAGDTSGFCWRSNRTVDFCTKGYDTFFLAYEETGDPRMLHALQAQVALAASAMNLGAILGPLLLALRGSVHDKVQLFIWGILLNSAMFIIYGVVRTPLALAAALFVLMIPLPATSSLFHSILQSKVPPESQGRVFATISQLDYIASSISFLAIGPLVDRVLEPAVSSPGWSRVAPIVGAHPGAGMGLVLAATGIIMLVVSVLAYCSPGVRQLEARVPDWEGETMVS
jgi:hypothetical protein